MSVAFFDDCLLKTGTVPSSELPTIAFILDMADVKVTVENLQPHVDAMHPNGKCALTAEDMKQLFTRFTDGTPQEKRKSDGAETKAKKRKSDSTESKAKVLDNLTEGTGDGAESKAKKRKSDGAETKTKVLDNVAENSNEVNKVYDMTLAELADALTENLQQKWQALPKRAQHLVLGKFNELLLKGIQHSVVQLDHEDILKIRSEKVDSVLPDLIDGEVYNGTGIYVCHGDSNDHL